MLAALWLFYRYSVFGLFVICSAIIASVAVWNISFVQSDGHHPKVDIFLVYLGASGLAFIFPLIFIQLIRRDALTSRVWFECLWVSLFFVMSLSGAIALSASVPRLMCNSEVFLITGHDACTSTSVLVAFTWISTICLLCYLVVLVAFAVAHRTSGRAVWQYLVCDLILFGGRQPIRSPSPPLDPPRFRSKALYLAAPVVLRPARPAPYIYRNGLGSEYEIEHYQPEQSLIDQSVKPMSFSVPVPAPAPTAPITQHLPRNAFDNSTSASLYAQNVRETLLTSSVRALPQIQTKNLDSLPQSLGEWPRADIMTQPVRNHRKGKAPQRPPQARVTVTREPYMDMVMEGSHVTQGANASPLDGSPDVSSTTPDVSPTTRTRPTGPRGRSDSKSSMDAHRPPPLDLSKISAYRTYRGNGNSHVHG